MTSRIARSDSLPETAHEQSALIRQSSRDRGDASFKSVAQASDKEKGPQKEALMSNVRPLAMSTSNPHATLQRPMLNGSLNTRSVVSEDFAVLKQTKLSEFENSTIVKQRHELNLLLDELKDRDIELNNMVESHKKQLLSWEKDRRTILSLDEKVSLLENEIQGKNDDIRAVTSKLRVAESEIAQRSTALSNTQTQLATMSEQQSEQLIRVDELHKQIENLTQANTYQEMEIKELETRNQQLCNSIVDLTNQHGQLEAREQELLTVIKLKDKDLLDSSKHVAELNTRLKKLEVQNESSRRNEVESRRSAGEWKTKYQQCWKEYDYYKHEFQSTERMLQDANNDINKARHDVANFKKELALAVERERRATQVLDLQRSKQDRSDQELQSMRDLYAQQERDISLLQLNLEGTKDLLHKQQERYLNKGYPLPSAETAKSVHGSSSALSHDGSHRSPGSSVTDLRYNATASSSRHGTSPSRQPRSSTSRTLNDARVAMGRYTGSQTRLGASPSPSPDRSRMSLTGTSTAYESRRWSSPPGKHSPTRSVSSTSNTSHQSRLKSMSPARIAGSVSPRASRTVGKHVSPLARYELYGRDGSPPKASAVDVSVKTSSSTTLTYLRSSTAATELNGDDGTGLLPRETHSSAGAFGKVNKWSSQNEEELRMNLTSSKSSTSATARAATSDIDATAVPSDLSVKSRTDEALIGEESATVLAHSASTVRPGGAADRVVSESFKSACGDEGGDAKESSVISDAAFMTPTSRTPARGTPVPPGEKEEAADADVVSIERKLSETPSPLTRSISNPNAPARRNSLEFDPTRTASPLPHPRLSLMSSLSSPPATPNRDRTRSTSIKSTSSNTEEATADRSMTSATDASSKAGTPTGQRSRSSGLGLSGETGSRQDVSVKAVGSGSAVGDVMQSPLSRRSSLASNASPQSVASRKTSCSAGVAPSRSSHNSSPTPSNTSGLNLSSGDGAGPEVGASVFQRSTSQLSTSSLRRGSSDRVASPLLTALEGQTSLSKVVSCASPLSKSREQLNGSDVDLSASLDPDRRSSFDRRSSCHSNADSQPLSLKALDSQ